MTSKQIRKKEREQQKYDRDKVLEQQAKRFGKYDTKIFDNRKMSTDRNTVP